MPAMSHQKPGAWKPQAWEVAEATVLTLQPRQLCLGPWGAVQRAPQLMGPDGLSLVCRHVPPAHSHSDFRLCFFPLETE